MSEELEARVWHAVEHGVVARASYYAAISLSNDQLLGAAAKESQLRLFETALKKQLPPSYRTFLQLHDGWKMAFGAVDLLSIAEMRESDRAHKIRAWQVSAGMLGDSIAANSLVIGFAEASSIKILLNPEVVDETGEWELLGHDNGIDWSFPSFLAWLEASVHDFNELTREEIEGDEYEESVIP